MSTYIMPSAFTCMHMHTLAHNIQPVPGFTINYMQQKHHVQTASPFSCQLGQIQDHIQFCPFLPLRRFKETHAREPFTSQLGLVITTTGQCKGGFRVSLEWWGGQVNSNCILSRNKSKNLAVLIFMDKILTHSESVMNLQINL